MICNRLKRLTTVFSMVVASVCMMAHEGSVDVAIPVPDSVACVTTDSISVCDMSEVADSVDSKAESKNFFQKIMDYFGNANKSSLDDKKFDVSFIGGPFYSSNLGVGLGVVGSGLYRVKGVEHDLQPSNVSLFGSVSTTGFYMLGIKGNNIFPEDRFRINYTLNFYSFPSYYWGIGYENGDNNDNKIKMDRWQSKIKGEFLAKIFENFYAGAVLTWDYVRGGGVEEKDMHLFRGMDLITRNYGMGLTLQYDSRDLITNASKGVYVYVNQMFRPKWLWNDYAFSTTEFITSVYKQVWKGGLIAGDLRGTFNFGNPSWAMMAKLGDTSSMRGYYEGRYRDKHSMAAQVELRQHVWRRNGVVVWVGAGTVFHDKKSFKHIFPNYGFGYRWEFKKRVNVRIDVGFGKPGQYGFSFNINEAF